MYSLSQGLACNQQPAARIQAKFTSTSLSLVRDFVKRVGLLNQMPNQLRVVAYGNVHVHAMHVIAAQKIFSYRIRQNFRRGKLLRFSRFFSQSRKFSP